MGLSDRPKPETLNLTRKPKTLNRPAAELPTRRVAYGRLGARLALLKEAASMPV